MTKSSLFRDVQEIARSSRRIRLREIRPTDYAFLYERALRPEESYRWRFRGQQPGYEEFVQSLTAGVLLQYIVTAESHDAPLGLVVCYGADFRNGHAYIGVQAAPPAIGTGLLLEAMRIFIDGIFETYDFKKLYAECPEFNMGRVASILNFGFVQEGKLVAHERFQNQDWDLYILALHRLAWRKQEDEWAIRTLQVGTDWSADQEVGQGPSFEVFCAAVCRSLNIDASVISSGTHLVEDLQFDSLAMVEFFEIVGSLGVVMDLNSYSRIRTMGDAHFHFIQASTA